MVEELLFWRVWFTVTTEPGPTDDCSSLVVITVSTSMALDPPVTAILSVAVAVPVPSLTWRVKLVVVATLAATKSAVIFPLVLPMVGTLLLYTSDDADD